MKVKSYIKNHKKEAIIIGGSLTTIGIVLVLTRNYILLPTKTVKNILDGVYTEEQIIDILCEIILEKPELSSEHIDAIKNIQNSSKKYRKMVDKV